jgi:tetratricopeptide (TPR) repeat protein
MLNHCLPGKISNSIWAINRRNALEACEEVNFQMKRTGYLGVSLFLLCVLALTALPGFAQDKQPQPKTRPEYDAYVAVFNEKDPAKKAALAEKFIADFKDSEMIPNAYTMMIGAFRDTKNWAKVTDAADQAVALPAADNKLKVYAYVNAMNAAQNLNNIDKVVSYGDKVLAIDPNELNTMITLSAVIPAKLPADAAGKNAALDKASGLATKALTSIQEMIGKADAQSKPQLEQIQGNLHGTLGLIAYNRQDYNKSIEEYEKAVQKTPKDEVAHFYLGLDFQTLAAQASRQYADAVKSENDAKAARADQPTIDELAARRQGLADDVAKARDRAMDEFATTVAIGGQLSGQAKDALTNLWKAKNNDSTAGLDEFINSKKM